MAEGQDRQDRGMRARPSFDCLPLHPNDPPYSAWALYEHSDQLGTLNLLTPSTVFHAAQQEIRTGRTIPLNLPLHIPSVPMNPARKPLEHEIIQKGHANDDQITLNTQASTQWDGLRHYPYQSVQHGERRFYNGVRQRDLINADGSCTPVLGIQEMARKGIQGRGVLLDWASWAERHDRAFHPFTAQSILLSDLQAVAIEQRTVFHSGDILLIRTGWSAAYSRLSMQEQTELSARTTRSFIGVEASEEMFRWHWEQGFAAVASDTNAYEVQPFGTTANPAGVSCHEVFLSGWGMPIGELWDLEALATACRELERWTFFLSSSPLNVMGGVGSPANAVAIL